MQVGNSLYSRVAFTETPEVEGRQDQCCDVTSDITLIKLLRFLNKSKGGTPKMGHNPKIRYNASVDADAPNQSLTISVNDPLGHVYTKHQRQCSEISVMMLTILFSLNNGVT